MQEFITKVIGKRKYTFVVEGDTLFDVVMESQKLSFGDVHKCGCCGSDNLILQARIAGDEQYEYTEIKCLGCRAQLVFGRPKKEKDTFYLRRKENDKEQYDWKPFESGD